MRKGNARGHVHAVVFRQGFDVCVQGIRSYSGVDRDFFPPAHAGNDQERCIFITASCRLAPDAAVVLAVGEPNVAPEDRYLSAQATQRTDGPDGTKRSERRQFDARLGAAVVNLSHRAIDLHRPLARGRAVAARTRGTAQGRHGQHQGPFGMPAMARGLVRSAKVGCGGGALVANWIMKRFVHERSLPPGPRSRVKPRGETTKGEHWRRTEGAFAAGPPRFGGIIDRCCTSSCPDMARRYSCFRL
jgi:hypothetical protein